MRAGNLAVTAAMVAAPIDHTSIDHFAKSMRLPMISCRAFHLNKSGYVNSMVKKLYAEHKSLVLEHVTDAPAYPLEIAIDGQYDSVGYSAELECESAMHVLPNSS
jgi:hypothetical protein